MAKYLKETNNRISLPKLLVSLGSIAATVAILVWMPTGFGAQTAAATVKHSDFRMGRELAAYVEEAVRLEPLAETELPEKVQTVYRLKDEDLVAPKPDPERFGTAQDPAQLKDLLEEAKGLLEGQQTLFTAETVIKEGSTVHYYLDETIFAVTWKQVEEECVYTMTEVKVAHPSQFRRFFAGGEYGSGTLYTTTQMSESVNAVAAASGDYHGYRRFGVVVNNGKVYRSRSQFLDTCYVDENGDLLFVYAADTGTEEETQKYVDENNIRFSLSFGPVMILDGQVCVPRRYNSGEINEPYARAALCQMGKLHYVVVTANTEKPHYSMHTVRSFAENLCRMGIPTAYALDGGQTASIVMNNELINNVSYGSQRQISDILYFATAIPSEG